MRDHFLKALGRTYAFQGWNFENEFEFKHELFHQLALLPVQGVPLVFQAPGAPSCRLHAEGKVLNGKPQKADILICDPTRRQRFNYEVEYVIELKHSLNRQQMAQEIEKLRSYGQSFKGFYLATDRIGSVPATMPALEGHDIHFFHRGKVDVIGGECFSAPTSGGFEDSLGAVRAALDATLADYGRGRQQYHSFFWCNYEHEEWRGHSFPSEGDFNAHFYHRLRNGLPAGVEVRSEVHPPGQSQRRIDFVVRDGRGEWAIPIEVKMNWDQFKPKFKGGDLQTSEAEVILGRMNALRRPYRQAHPIVVVIQGFWQQRRDVRAQAMPVLERAAFPVELVTFNEGEDRIHRQSLGGG